MSRWPTLLVALLAWASAAGAERPPSLRALIEMADLSSVAISPDGKMVAYREARASIERNAHILSWYVVPLDGSAPPRRLADAGEGEWLNGTLLSERPLWSADSRFLLYRAAIDGEVQLWRAAADGSSVVPLTHDPGNVHAIALADQGRAVVYRAGAPREAIARAERAEYDGGTLVDAAVDPSRPLFRGGRIDGRRATERLRGAWFGHGGLLADDAAVHAVEIVSGTERPARREETDALAPPAAPFERRDGRLVVGRAASGDVRGTAYILSSGTTHTLRVERPDREAPIDCSAPACASGRFRSLTWQQGVDALVIEAADGRGGSTLLRWDVATGAVRTLAAGQGLLNGGRDQSEGCAVGVRSMVCVAADADVPPQLVALDLGSGAQRPLAAPNADLAGSGPRFASLVWQDAEGRGFTGQLLLPEHRPGPVPLFITYYSCGGYLRGGLGDEFPLRALAEAGIAALCINRYPGRDGVGDQVGAYRIAQAGIEAIVARLAGQRLIDPARIGMGGVSFGGEATIWIAMHSRLLAAMSIANVLLTPSYYWFNAVRGRDVPGLLRTGWGLGDPDGDRKGWQALSPALNAARIHTPLLMQLPELEFRPNVELLARLQRTGTPVELWAFPDEVHIKWQPRHQLAANQRNLDWFRFWLTGWTDPDPAKAAQYARWRGEARRGGDLRG